MCICLYIHRHVWHYRSQVCISVHFKYVYLVIQYMHVLCVWYVWMHIYMSSVWIKTWILIPRAISTTQVTSAKHSFSEPIFLYLHNINCTTWCFCGQAHVVLSLAHMRCERGNTTSKIRKAARRKHEENAQNPCPDGIPPQSSLTSGCGCFRFGGDVLPFCPDATLRNKVLSFHLYKEDTVSCVAILNNEKERKTYKRAIPVGRRM